MRAMASCPDRAVRVRGLAEDIVLCSWARHVSFSVPLSTQMYKWVRAKRVTSHPGGRRNTLSRFMLTKPTISSGIMSHLVCMQTLLLIRIGNFLIASMKTDFPKTALVSPTVLIDSFNLCVAIYLGHMEFC